MNRDVAASSARARCTRALSGVARQQAGQVQRDVGVGGSGALPVIVTRTSRPASASACAALRHTGTIAMSGVTRTLMAGTTSSSVRFSPLKMLPS